MGMFNLLAPPGIGQVNGLDGTAYAVVNGIVTAITGS